MAKVQAIAASAASSSQYTRRNRITAAKKGVSSMAVAPCSRGIKTDVESPFMGPPLELVSHLHKSEVRVLSVRIDGLNPRFAIRVTIVKPGEKMQVEDQ